MQNDILGLALGETDSPIMDIVRSLVSGYQQQPTAQPMQISGLDPRAQLMIATKMMQTDNSTANRLVNSLMTGISGGLDTIQRKQTKDTLSKLIDSGKARISIKGGKFSIDSIDEAATLKDKLERDKLESDMRIAQLKEARETKEESRKIIEASRAERNKQIQNMRLALNAQLKNAESRYTETSEMVQELTKTNTLESLQNNSEYINAKSAMDKALKDMQDINNKLSFLGQAKSIKEIKSAEPAKSTWDIRKPIGQVAGSAKQGIMDIINAYKGSKDTMSNVIVKTGTDKSTGRKVVQYSNGRIEYR